MDLLIASFQCAINPIVRERDEIGRMNSFGKPLSQYQLKGHYRVVSTYMALYANAA